MNHRLVELKLPLWVHIVKINKYNWIWNNSIPIKTPNSNNFITFLKWFS